MHNESKQSKAKHSIKSSVPITWIDCTDQSDYHMTRVLAWVCDITYLLLNDVQVLGMRLKLPLNKSNRKTPPWIDFSDYLNLVLFFVFYRVVWKQQHFHFIIFFFLFFFYMYVFEYMIIVMQYNYSNSSVNAIITTNLFIFWVFELLLFD